MWKWAANCPPALGHSLEFPAICASVIGYACVTYFLLSQSFPGASAALPPFPPPLKPGIQFSADKK